jgi:hypothetical protein
MSGAASPTPQLVIQIADIAVNNENTHAEVATSPNGIVTDSFGPTQIVLRHPHILATLHTGEIYEIRAAKPHFHSRNMHYIHRQENGDLLFRAPVTKT